MSKATKANKARAIEWAEYVLPIWEKYYPKDDRPRRAVEAAKAKDAASDASAYAATYADAYAAYAASAACAASATYAADTAYAAAFAADAAVAAHAAHAAYDAAYAASSAAYAADAAADAILLERYGEDIVKVRKVLLLKEFIDFDSIKWIDYKPEQFWDVALETYCA